MIPLTTADCLALAAAYFVGILTMSYAQGRGSDG